MLLISFLKSLKFPPKILVYREGINIRRPDHTHF